MTPNMVGFSFLLIGVCLIIGKVVRLHTKWLRNLFLPSSIIAGFIALFLGPDVLGRLTSQFLEQGSMFYNGLMPGFILDVWRHLPGMFINIVFAALFLGKKVPGVRKIWDVAGPQIVMGQAVSSSFTTKETRYFSAERNWWVCETQFFRFFHYRSPFC